MKWLAALILAAGTLSGCGLFKGTAGAIEVRSLSDDPVTLASDFTTGLFTYDEDTGAGASFMLTDVPLDDLFAGKVSSGQILHVQVLWIPLAGSTPMDASATNASIRYVVVADGEVGVYSGAGFAMPLDDLNDKRVTISLRDATLQLQDSTAGFNDLLSPANLSGNFKTQRDDRRARQMNRAASQLVTNALGKTRLVMAGQF